MLDCYQIWYLIDKIVGCKFTSIVVLRIGFYQIAVTTFVFFFFPVHTNTLIVFFSLWFKINVKKKLNYKKKITKRKKKSQWKKFL